MLIFHLFLGNKQLFFFLVDSSVSVSDEPSGTNMEPLHTCTAVMCGGGFTQQVLAITMPWFECHEDFLFSCQSGFLGNDVSPEKEAQSAAAPAQLDSSRFRPLTPESQARVRVPV